MKYKKEALTLEQQADRLIGRGLVGDREELITRLRMVNYYRLSGYLYPFRQSDQNYLPGTTLDEVWRRYSFDRSLRILLLDVIERIEVAVRTSLVYHFVEKHGPFGHLDEKNLPKFKKRSWKRRLIRNTKSLVKLKGLELTAYQTWLTSLRNEKDRASESFVRHFRRTYGDSHDHLPLWMACELMTCGGTLQFANSVEPDVLKKAAADFGFPDQQLLSWSKAIFALRNSCAHHSLVWSRTFGVKPSVPGKNKNPLWHQDPTLALDRVGLMLTVCYFWLQRISPIKETRTPDQEEATDAATEWKSNLISLFDEYPEIPLADMGLSETWREHPLWKDSV